MAPHVFHAQLSQVVNCCGETNSPFDIWCSCLKFIRNIGPGGTIQVNLTNHFPSPHEWGHLLKQVRSAVEAAYAHRSKHLMPGKGKKIAANAGHINRHVRDTLGSVHDHDRTVVVCDSRNLL